MSADNWDICPRCVANQEKKKIKLVRRLLDAAYGNVTEAEYMKLRQEVSKPMTVEHTLREDYNIRTDKFGEFFVLYTCRCSSCNLSHKFEHKEQLEI